MRPSLRFLQSAVVASCALIAADLPAQSVRGRVIDASSLASIAGAQVRLLSPADSTLASVVADDSGRFVLRGQQGEFRLNVARFGYQAATVGPVRLVQDAITDVVIRLAVDAVAIDALTVEAEAIVPWLDRVGFYERKRIGQGTFIDRLAIEKRNPRRTSDILRGIAGVRITHSRPEGTDVFLRAALSASIVHRQCRPPIFLDGIAVATQLGNRIDLDSILPGDVEAIEVYAGAAQVPPKYGGATSACGVILLWTRR